MTSGASTRPPVCPLVFGITGHRDIPADDVPKLAEAINGFIQGYANQFPSTPLQLLTPLAEGADRIAAKVFLDAGHEILVILPFETEEYKNDFASDDSRAEFNRLLAQAAGSIVVEPDASVVEALDGRDACYFEAGRFVAVHSAIMIAAWDGEPAQSAAGTGAIVALVSPELDAVKAGVPVTLAKLAAADERNVYRIPVRRERRLMTGDKSMYQGAWLNGPLEIESNSFQRLEAYNCSLRKLFSESNPIPQPKQIAKDLLGDWGESEVSSLSQTSLINFASADALANKFGKQARGHFRLLYWSYFLAGIFALLYGTAVEKDWMIGLFMLLLGVLQIPIWLFKRFKIQENHLNFRALAESLRVHNYWSASGIQDEVADHFLERTKDEDGWIRLVLRHCSLSDRIELNSATSSGARSRVTESSAALKAVATKWVEGQAGFYRSRSAKMTRDQRSKERLAKILVFIGIGLLLMEAVFRMSLRFFPNAYLVESIASWSESCMSWVETKTPWFPDPTGELNRKHPLLMVPAGLCMAFAGFLATYNAKLQFLELAKHYERSARVFSNASKSLQPVLENGNDDEARKEIKRLGVEALSENGIWMLLHQNRPLNPT